MNRRRFLKSNIGVLAFIAGAAAPARPVFAADGSWPKDASFSFDALSDRMRHKAREPWREQPPDLPEAIASLTYDQYRAIRYRADRALWRGADTRYHVQAFHPGWLYKRPVRIYEVHDGHTEPFVFSAADFKYDQPLDPAAFAGIDLPGVAGFRLHYPINRPDYRDELISFLGASYFRALGRGSVYGLSARGLAIDTASSDSEEFPAFTAFYLERPRDRAKVLRLWASLESRSVAGAYAFEITPGAETVIDVTARLHFRLPVQRLGLAPLTSMFLFGENDDRGFDDYRPEVHDSDSLVILNGDDEQAVRPLRNPPSLRVSFFHVTNPKGFGLAQRDRAFDHYQDLEARYDKRPNAWIEPIGDWGKGRVVLVEIPSDNEFNDNIVSFWQPYKEPEAGEAREYRYRMRWGADAGAGRDVAEVTSTHTGHGGIAGAARDPQLRKFVVDFDGGMLANLPREARLTPVVEAANADVADVVLQPTPKHGCWRLVVDARKAGTEPAELRAFLSFNDMRLSETWLYQWSVE